MEAFPSSRDINKVAVAGLDAIFDKYTKYDEVSEELPISPGLDKTLKHFVEEAIPRDPENPEDYRQKMRLVSMGGENLVLMFEGQKHRQTVYKINYREAYLNRKLLARDKNSVKAELEAMVAPVNQKISKARQYFGSEAVVPQRCMVRELPVNNEIASNLVPSWVDQGDLPKEIPVIVTVQRRMEIPSADTVSINGTYPEKFLIYGKRNDTETYKLAYGYMLEDMEDESRERFMDWVILDQYPGLVPIVDLMQRDERFKEALREAVAKMVRFSNETGILLELAGKNNIAMVKTGDFMALEDELEWKLIMPDIITPSLNMTLEDLTKKCEMLVENGGLSMMQMELALNELNSVRFVNFLAKLTGVRDRIKADVLKKLNGQAWLDLFLSKSVSRAA